MFRKYENYLDEKKSDLIDDRLKARNHYRNVWNVLHTTAAFFPNRPSPSEQVDFKEFVEAVVYFSVKDPAWKDNSKEFLSRFPMEFESRDKACLWICHYHNFVNLRTGKDQLPCDMEFLNRRWGYGA